MQHKRTLAFIGAGNMSRSIIAGTIREGDTVAIGFDGTDFTFTPIGEHKA